MTQFRSTPYTLETLLREGKTKRRATINASDAMEDGADGKVTQYLGSLHVLDDQRKLSKMSRELEPNRRPGKLRGARSLKE